ncbi:MAG TPA: ribosome maturation factor RimP [Candidatus Binatia bacterium]|nr:ribosome maturation factor RimP [Candidatus Binatia bacterium]
MSTNGSKIWAIAEPLAVERGLELLDVELAGSGSRQLVRIFLDSPDPSRAVSLEDCEAVSRRLGDALEAHEVVRSNYMLEVSSPGLSRPLKKAEHFERVVGKKVRVRMRNDVDGQRNFLGRLDEVAGGAITVTEESGKATRLVLAEVEKANLEYEFEKKTPPRRRAR